MTTYNRTDTENESIEDRVKRLVREALDAHSGDRSDEAVQDAHEQALANLHFNKTGKYAGF